MSPRSFEGEGAAVGEQNASLTDAGEGEDILSTNRIGMQRSMTEARRDSDYWGRLVESCVGAHLINPGLGTGVSVTYWRERNHEVDFILQQGNTTVAIEVKSGRRRELLPGMDAFASYCINFLTGRKDFSSMKLKI